MTGWGRRQLNEVSWHRNPLGEYFVFGEVGSGENSVIVTLCRRKTERAIKAAYAHYKRYLGTPMNNVTREKC